ncbi:polysaccharide lyase beta-sandwich domain-containing protein [Algibacter luteus]|nr:polysaccharide lyase beta-sandwich domain-containing protein [Algibacter luteus]WJJ97765.1 polysaccharide lyase beta-sandwich domain-containing protein [Algibacter luteus]
MSGIVFDINGTSKIKGGITVNQPCDVMLEEKERQLELFLSDPTHKLSI